MKSFFNNDFFKGNRDRLQNKFESMPIVVTANGLLQRGGDSTYAFSQDANFWYLTGVNDPDILLVIDDGEEYLIVPSRSGVREAFDGAVATSGLSKRSGIS